MIQRLMISATEVWHQEFKTQVKTWVGSTERLEVQYSQEDAAVVTASYSFISCSSLWRPTVLLVLETK